MPISFPNNPLIGDIYDYGGIHYIYTGDGWVNTSIYGVTAGTNISFTNYNGTGPIVISATDTTGITSAVTLFNGKTGAVQGVSSINGSTGAISNVAFTNTAQTFSGLQSFSAGISASGGTFSGNIVLQNSEFIRNSTNGFMDFMPDVNTGNSASNYGMYMDFTSWGYGVQIGTVRSSDNTRNVSNRGFLFNGPITTAIDTKFSFDSAQKYSIATTATGLDTMQIIAYCDGSANSGAVALVDLYDFSAVNRSPGIAHSNPNLYIYAAGNASANDFMRLEHGRTAGLIQTGGTSGLTLAAGSGVVGISGGIITTAGGTFAGNVRVGTDGGSAQLDIRNHSSRYLSLIDTGSGASRIVSSGNSELQIYQENGGSIYIGDSSGNGNLTYIIVDDSNQQIAFNYGSENYTFPTSVGGAGQVLTTDGNLSSTLSWATPVSINGNTGAITNVAFTNVAQTFSALQSFSAGISASGGTFSGPIQSTRLARFTSALFETKTASWSVTDADDGKIFISNPASAKATLTCTIDGLSTGVHFKILVKNGTLAFSSSSGTISNENVGSITAPASVTVYCTGSNSYHVTDSA